VTIKDIALYVNKDKNGKSYFGVVITEPYKKPDAMTIYPDKKLPESKFDIPVKELPMDDNPPF
jgi:hypothetical protein